MDFTSQRLETSEEVYANFLQVSLISHDLFTHCDFYLLDQCFKSGIRRGENCDLTKLSKMLLKKKSATNEY